MSAVEIITLIIAVGLFFYLTGALLKPEWFS
jgi:K+-transporting ATPase KdpF subunit